MTSSIRDTYLREAAKLELEDLLAVDPKNDEAYARNVEKFQSLSSLYDETLEQLDEPAQKKIKRVHAQVSFLFCDPGAMLTKTYLQAKQVHYLRIAAEHNQVKLVRKYFRTLSIEQRRSVFKMLCDNLGRPLAQEKTSKNGIYHIAKDPRNLLAPIGGVMGYPRIIDVLLHKQIPSPPSTTKPTNWVTNNKIRSRDVFAFYKGMGSLKGLSLRSILGQGNPKIWCLQQELRWLFPIAEDVDDPSFVRKFKADEWCMGNLENSFTRMLDVYGLQRTGSDITRKSKLFKGTIFPLLDPNSLQWQQNIERILKCLHDLGLSDDAHNFLKALKHIAENEGMRAIPPSAIKKWEMAVGL